MGVTDALKGRQVYLDANVFIYAVEGIPPYVGPMRELFGEVDAGSVRAATSELTLAEALVRPMADGNTELQAAYQDVLQTRDGLQLVPVSRSILVEAARLRAENHALKLPDAIHVATARASGCEALLTNDRALTGASGLQVVLCSELLDS